MRLGIDIGGTKTAAVAVDDDGRLLERVNVGTPRGAEAVLATSLEAVTSLQGARGIGSGTVTIGVGIPGVVDTATGRVRHAVNLGFDQFDLGAALHTRLGVPVHVENDVKAATLGASRLLGATESMAYLNLGTGTAAGFLLDGHVWHGARGVSGEIGHIPVDPHGVVCACGQRGCIETTASGAAIAAAWPHGDVPARSLYDAADSGDVEARAIRGRFVRGIAAAVRVLVLTVDVDTIVIGGGLSRLGDRLLGDVRKVLAEWADSSAFLHSLHLAERIRLLPDDYPAAAVGAALVGAAASAAVVAREPLAPAE